MEQRTEILVDARGLYCPMPILRLAKAFVRKPSGTVALLLATDPAADEDVRAFCKEGGHELLSLDHDGNVLRFRVKRG